RGAAMASADGLGWPEETRQPAAAPAAHRSHVESSGLGWPWWDPGGAAGQAHLVGAEKERVTVAQAADERAEEEPPARVRQALSAAGSREPDALAPDGAAGEGPGRDSPAGGAGQQAATAPTGQPATDAANGEAVTGAAAGRGTAEAAAGQVGAAAVASGPGRPAMT